MKKRTKLLYRRELPGGLLEFRLERPVGYDFRAGQYCFLALPDRALGENWGLRRHLSFASSPSEPDLLFATRLSDSVFKKSLASLPVGSDVAIEEPMGSLRLPEGTARPLVFLAGGVGITPFRSMLRHAADTTTGHRITLFYSNRRPEETLFLYDLLQIPAATSSIRVVATMTRMAESTAAWDGRTGRLTAATIQAECPYWGEADYYLAGPPSMVETMQTTLQELGIEAKRVRTELFTGY